MDVNEYHTFDEFKKAFIEKQPIKIDISSRHDGRNMLSNRFFDIKQLKDSEGNEFVYYKDEVSQYSNKGKSKKIIPELIEMSMFLKFIKTFYKHWKKAINDENNKTPYIAFKF